MDLGPNERELFSGHPSWRSMLTFYGTGLAPIVVVGVIVWFAASHAAGIGAAAAVLVLVLLVGFIRRLRTTYVITSQRLQIRRGLVARNIQDAKLERVQNVTTRQSVFERLLQIGTLDFDTAGSSDSDFSFAGIAQPEKVARKIDTAQREHAQADANPPRSGSVAAGL